jgi:hypothetical protein
MNVLILACALMAANPEPRQTVIVVVGAEGAPEYAPQFQEWAGRWKTATERGQADFHLIGLEESAETSDRTRLQRELEQAAEVETDEPLCLVLIGHGTFDGKTARFNLRGPDVSPADLGEWLQGCLRPVAIIDCASCSSPFLVELSARGRVIVSATKSGFEHNVTRFGDYFSQALLDPQSDLDKDDQVSLLEAWLMAAVGVREFYAKEGRLETEHSLLDDNGDRLGTPPDWFRGTRAVKAGKDGGIPDGAVAARLCLVRSRQEQSLSPEQRKRRDHLERELAALRSKKGTLAEPDYLDQIELLLLELARLYEQSPVSDSPPAANSELPATSPEKSPPKTAD